MGQSKLGIEDEKCRWEKSEEEASRDIELGCRGKSKVGKSK